MPTAIYYLGQNSTDHTVTFAIGKARWEYWLTPQQIESVDHLKRISLGKALAFAKKHASYARTIQ